MQFIDLFAGLGGFHLALEQLGHQCVFASEINKPLASLYTKNYNLEPFGDICKVNIKTEIPAHDILCGGFPCQPFSIAGKKSGKKHNSGNLFDKIVEILEIKKPKFFILENVPHIKQLERGTMWRHIEDCFKYLGYDFRDKKDERVIKNYIIQFRQSGVRIKKIDSSPALVCTSTEIPIIGWQNRYITKNIY